MQKLLANANACIFVVAGCYGWLLLVAVAGCCFLWLIVVSCCGWLLLVARAGSCCLLRLVVVHCGWLFAVATC